MNTYFGVYLSDRTNVLIRMSTLIARIVCYIYVASFFVQTVNTDAIRFVHTTSSTSDGDAASIAIRR